MAIVGSAYVVVRAMTEKVEGDIKRGFSGASAAAGSAGKDMGESIAKGFGKGVRSIKVDTLSSKFSEAINNSTQLADELTSLARKSHVAQAGLGALLGSVGALVGGLGALGGAVLGATPAIVGLVGAFGALRVGIAVGQLALGGVIAAVQKAATSYAGYGKSIAAVLKMKRDLAFAEKSSVLGEKRAALDLEKARQNLIRTQDMPVNSMARREALLAYQEADLAYQEAIQKSKDAKAELKNPNIFSGTDPFAGLTETQKKFAEYLVSIRPKLMDLKEAAAKGFLPLLQSQMDRMIKGGVLDILKARFYDIGKGLGVAVKNFNDIFLTQNNLKNFDAVLKSFAKVLPSFGTIFGNVFGGLLTILRAAEPLTIRFVNFLENKSNALAQFLDTKSKSGELAAFFARAGELAAQLGRIFGNALGGLGNIIMANFGPNSGGQAILTWLEQVTLGWKNADMGGMAIYFKGAATNFIAMGKALGHALEIIISYGSSPKIAELWTILDSASLSFDKIMKGAIDAAPSIGKLIKAVVDFAAVLADASATNAFLGTLSLIIEGAAGALKSIEGLINIIGGPLGVISAVLLAEGAFLKLGGAMVGFGIKALSTFGLTNVAMKLIPKTLMEIIPAAEASGGAMTFALGPVGVAIAAVVAGLAAIVVAWNAFGADRFSKSTKGITQGFKEGASATKIWGQAILNVADGPAKQQISSIKDMKSGMDRLAKAQKDWTYSLPSTTAIADSFGAIGNSLGNLATNDLPAAQAQFKAFTKEVGFNNIETQTALNEMDDYKTALIKQADQLGINIRNKNGDLNMQKLTNLALGEGEIALRKAKKAQEDFANSVNTGAQSFIDYQTPLSQNKSDVMAWAKQQAASTKDAKDSWKTYWDGQSFSMDKYLSDLDKQVVEAGKWKTNIAKLMTTDLKKEVLDKLVSMKQSGAQIVAALTDGINDKAQIDKLNKNAEALGGSLYQGVQNGIANAASKNMATFTGYYGSQFLLKGKPVSGRKDGGFIGRFASGGLISKFAPGGFVSGAGTARSDSIPAMLSNGEYVINARATAQNRTLLDAINSNKAVAQQPGINITVNPAPGMNERDLAEMVSRKLAFELRRGAF
jgi:hypothetical protein